VGGGKGSCWGHCVQNPLVVPDEEGRRKGRVVVVVVVEGGGGWLGQ